jgi:serine/threonine-protein kinase
LSAAVVALTLCADPAHAEGDSAAAQALFDEAKALMGKGKHAQACPKLEESQRLDPGLGTLFNLAECNEKTGRIATAWSRYLVVAAGARSAGRGDAERVARGRADALQPKLPKLVIEVPVSAQASGLEVTRDGQRVGDAQWGTAIPVDPGEHEVRATAPGRKPWQTKVQTPQARETRAIVPVLLVSDEPPAEGPSPPASTTDQGASPAPPPASEPPPPSTGSGQRTLGLVIAGVGVAALGGSVALGAMAKSQYDGVSCPKNECTRDAGAERDSAGTKATIATIVGSIGGAALVGGAVLFFVAPSSKDEPTGSRRRVTVGVVPGGLLVRGTL